MKPLNLCLLAVPLAAAGCSHVAFADTCAHQEPREASVSTEGAAKIHVVARAGSLTVLGKPSVSTAEANGTACATNPSHLSDMRLIAERRGDTVWIESVFDNNHRGNRSLSFTVEIPNSLPLEVEDGSGSIEIRDVAALRLKDGSGSVNIRGVNGDLDVEDGSGQLEIENVAGAARIHDGSGSLHLRDVRGSVDIDDDSGEVDIAQVNGDVAVEDGSGGLSVRRVVGNVRIEDGSGGIDVDDVEGDLVVSNAGSGGLDYNNVSGRIDVPRKR